MNTTHSAPSSSRVRPWLRSAALALAPIAALAAPAAAQDAKELKAARAQLAKAGKAAVAEHAAYLSERLGIARQQLAGIAHDLHEQELSPIDLVTEIGECWAGFMQTLGGYTWFAQTNLEAVAVELLENLAEMSAEMSAEMPAALPRDFGPGDGGRLDRTHALLQRNNDRALRRALKIHRSWAAGLVAKHGIAVNLLLEAGRPPAIAPGLQGASVPPPYPGMVIEVLVAASRLDTSGDGALHVSGVTTGDGDPTLDVLLLHPGGFAVAPDAPLDDARFSVQFHLLAEDAYKVMISKQGYNLARAIAVP